MTNLDDRRIREILRTHCYLTLGHCVTIWRDDIDRACDWLEEQQITQYLCMNRQYFRARTAREVLNDIDPVEVDPEEKILDAMNLNLEYSMDEDYLSIMGLRARRFIYFLDPDLALLFKLSWGSK